MSLLEIFKLLALVVPIAAATYVVLQLKTLKSVDKSTKTRSSQRTFQRLFFSILLAMIAARIAIYVVSSRNALPTNRPATFHVSGNETASLTIGPYQRATVVHLGATNRVFAQRFGTVNVQIFRDGLQVASQAETGSENATASVVFTDRILPGKIVIYEARGRNSQAVQIAVDLTAYVDPQ